jgi:hypothetical protein
VDTARELKKSSPKIKVILRTGLIQPGQQLGIGIAPPKFLRHYPHPKWVIHLIEFVLKEAILQIRGRAASMDRAPASNTPELH